MENSENPLENMIAPNTTAPDRFTVHDGNSINRGTAGTGEIVSKVIETAAEYLHFRLKK